MPAHPQRRTDINLTTDERRSYMRWWLERSGLTPDQVRELATGIWSDGVVDGTHGSLGPHRTGKLLHSRRRPALPGFVFRSATDSAASDIASNP